jgi:hypothetical protein
MITRLLALLAPADPLPTWPLTELLGKQPCRDLLAQAEERQRQKGNVDERQD